MGNAGDLVDRASRQQIATFRLFGEAPGATLIERDGVLIIDTGQGFAPFNGVLDTNISDDDVQGLEKAIANTKAHFAARDIPWVWRQRPSTRPTDLGERLLAAGFEPAGAQPAMTRALREGTTPDMSVDGLDVRPVRSKKDLATYCDVAVRGFAMPEFVGELIGDVLLKVGLDRGSEAQSLVGVLDGEAVATATVFLHGDTAGIYTVATLPSARRRGVGAAMTSAAEHVARVRGFDYATLQSSEAGYRVYLGLGYEEVCTFATFTPGH